MIDEYTMYKKLGFEYRNITDKRLVVKVSQQVDTVEILRKDGQYVVMPIKRFNSLYRRVK